MINGLFETHVSTTSLETAIQFYCKLGLSHAYTEKVRRVAFFWIGKPGQAMLGVWEVPREKWVSQHFAIHVDLKQFHESLTYLKDRGITLRNISRTGEEPEVHAWMPAVSIYFRDPDGNSLEFISMLPDEPQPDLGIVPFTEWEKMHQR